MKIKEMPRSERPRERMVEYGARFLSNSELLSIVIGSGNQEDTALDLASGMLNSDSRGLSGLASLTVEELEGFKGIGRATACRIAACIELAKRMNLATDRDELICGNPEKTADAIMERLRYYREEHFLALLLDNRGRAISIEEIAIGNGTNIVISPREVFAMAIRKGAIGIILAHNHPSGDPEPSADDMEATKRMIEAGKILGIKVYDHIIIGDGRYISFLEQNMMT